MQHNGTLVYLNSNASTISPDILLIFPLVENLAWKDYKIQMQFKIVFESIVGSLQ